MTNFIDGFLSLCSAAGSGAVTEMGTQPRQPVSFSLTQDRHPISGVWGLARNTNLVKFSYPVTGPIAGLGLFSAPIGGVLLAAMPFSAARPLVGGGSAWRCGVGDVVLVIDALAVNPNPASEPNAPYAAGATIGSWWDAPAIGAFASVPAPGAYQPPGGYAPSYLNAMPLTSGVGLLMQRGVLNVQL